LNDQFLKNHYDCKKKIAFLKILFVFYVFSVNITLIKCEETENSIDTLFQSSIFIMVGTTYGANAGSFFKDYKTYLGGYYNDFKTEPSLTVGTKVVINENFRLTASTSYIYSYLNESYNQKFKSSKGDESRYINQRIDIKSTPVFVSLEYFPYKEQFKSYIGGGVGLCYTGINWVEKVFSTYETDSRKGGIHLSENGLKPAFTIFAAIDLGFDKRPEETFIGSLLLETKFSYFFRKYRMFSKLAKQLRDNKGDFDNFYTIIPYYIGLNMGVTFNFVRKI